MHAISVTIKFFRLRQTPVDTSGKNGGKLSYQLILIFKK